MVFELINNLLNFLIFKLKQKLPFEVLINYYIFGDIINFSGKNSFYWGRVNKYYFFLINKVCLKEIDHLICLKRKLDFKIKPKFLKNIMFSLF